MPFTDSIKMVEVIMADKASLSATPTEVVNGKTFIGSTKNIETGTMRLLDERSDIELLAGESCNIPNGYNPVSYNVKAKDSGGQTPGTATASDILSTKTAWVNGEKITGVMTNVGKETDTLVCGAKHYISKGYHNGTGYVEATSLKDQTYGTAVASDVLKDKTFWVDGELRTGTIETNEVKTTELSAGGSYDIPSGYHIEGGKVTAKDLASQTVGDAIADYILENKTAWVNGVKLTGNLTQNEPVTAMLPMNGTYYIPYGYHTGTGKVTQSIPTKDGQTVTPSKSAQTIQTAGYYMNGNIVVSGVDGLEYQTSTSNYMKDSSGNNIADYAVDVPTTRIGTIYLNEDNWHNNSSFNVYKVIINDSYDVHIEQFYNKVIYVVYKNGLFSTYDTTNFGQYMTIVCNFSSEKNCQYIEFSNVVSLNVTIIDMFSARQF